MKSLVMKVNKVLCVSLCISVFGCAEIANNNVTPGKATTYGKQEASQRQQAASQQPNASQAIAQGQTHTGQNSIDCSALDGQRGNMYFKSPVDSTEKLTTVKVGASGYGAPPKNYYPEGQRRLMTIRASKIDAYRALAEIVGGLHVWGGSAIGDMVIERDRYRVFIDSFVRGAHVMSVEAMEDNTYKTVVEMEVDQRFLNHVMTFINPAADRYCYEREADGSMKYFGYSVAPSFYYSE